MSQHDKRFPEGIIPPENGWIENTWYLCEVSYKEGNPVHETLFYTGFLNGKDKSPGGYNCLVPINGTGDHRHTEIDQVRYLKAIKLLHINKKG